MKKVFHKTVSIVLAFVVFFSTMSFTIDIRYCGDTLVDVSFFAEAESYGMNSDLNKSSDCSVAKNSCCKNEQLVVEGQNELKVSFGDLDFSKIQFITSFLYSYTKLFKSLPKQLIPHKNYSPPNLVLDIQVLDETFLI